MNTIVNLMGTQVPSNEDISNWMQAKILASCPMPEWMFTMQKLVGICAGALLGDPQLAYQPTDDEVAELKAFANVAREAQAAGRQARTERALLLAALAIEAGTFDGEASQEALDLVAVRAAVRPVESPVEDQPEDQAGEVA